MSSSSPVASAPAGASAARYIVDSLFSRNHLHLIFGPPRSGRTSLLHQTGFDWSHGRDILGHASHPAYFCFVDATQPLDAFRAALGALYPDPDALPPHIAMIESTTHEDRNAATMFKLALALTPRPSVIFLDGLQALFHGSIISHREVLNFGIDITRLCQLHRVTLIATLDTAKSHDNPATPIVQRISGSYAWSTVARSLLHICWEEGRELESERTLTLYKPRLRPQQFHYDFNESGLLIPADAPTANPQLDQWLAQIAPGSIITARDIQEAATDRKVSRATAFRWIKMQVQLGALVQSSRGQYTVVAFDSVSN